MKFRKKPVVIDAIQWDGTLSGLRAIEAVLPTIDTRGVTAHPPSNTVSWWRIGTLEGGHDVISGDWIITGVKGEHYACKPDIFKATYEAVEDGNE